MKTENLPFSLDKEKVSESCRNYQFALINFSSGEEMWSVAFQIHATSLLQTTLSGTTQAIIGE